MKTVNRKILEQVIAASAEPVMIVRLDHTDWPVVLGNPACAAIGGEDALSKPFADVIEELVGRELAIEISEAFRSRQETSLPVEAAGDEYLLALKPLLLPNEESARFYAVFWRGSAGGGARAGADTHHELLKAKRKIRDLTRDDPVTGLLNSKAFREVLEHDWTVAARERSKLALVLFTLNDFDAYIEVFGRHASDTCRRRVGQAIRRCLRRASDVVASLDSARLIVLSHASDEHGVHEFAEKISTAVRELGLHHPRSSSGRFVTVSHRVAAATAGEDAKTATSFLNAILAEESGKD
ncbi:MAG: GGDEF domain-containing protein [Gammaproteobacteria bacterium]|nr:GGDEF domain-containing protein [Gammaproteobacteria bacterium]